MLLRSLICRAAAAPLSDLGVDALGDVHLVGGWRREQRLHGEAGERGGIAHLIGALQHRQLRAEAAADAVLDAGAQALRTPSKFFFFIRLNFLNRTRRGGAVQA